MRKNNKIFIEFGPAVTKKRIQSIANFFKKSIANFFNVFKTPKNDISQSNIAPESSNDIQSNNNISQSNIAPESSKTRFWDTSWKFNVSLPNLP